MARTGQWLAAALLAACAVTAQAADERDTTGYQPVTEQPYSPTQPGQQAYGPTAGVPQPMPQMGGAQQAVRAQSQSFTGSPNIIGYQPISNDQLVGPATATPMPGDAAAMNPSLPMVYQTGVVGDGMYTLGRDDVIAVQVRNQPDFSGTFVVGYNGRIQYPYIGDLPVAGMTKYEVQQVLEQLLEEFVRSPVVDVLIVGYNSKVVYVIGELNLPGKFIMRGDVLKLREAVLAAGLPTRRAALRRVHVIKPDLTDPDVRVINLKKILYQGKLKQDVDLYAGDIVVVPSTVLSNINDFLSNLLNPASRANSLARIGGVYAVP